MKRLIQGIILLAASLILPWDGIELARFAGAETTLVAKNYIDVHMHLVGQYRERGGMVKDFESAALNLIARMDKVGVAKAFGEMTSLHFSFREGHPFEQVAADHPLFLLLADIAAQHDIPIDLHMEAVIQDRALPERLSGISSENPPTIKATIPAFERMLDHNKNAKIVWQHVGWDQTGEMTPELVRRLLEAHPNLYCAIHESRQILDESGKIRDAWLKLISDYPDRFMIGADNFIGIPGKTRSIGPDTFDKIWGIISQFPADLAKKISHDNAARIYHLD